MIEIIDRFFAFNTLQASDYIIQHNLEPADASRSITVTPDETHFVAPKVKCPYYGLSCSTYYPEDYLLCYLTSMLLKWSYTGENMNIYELRQKVDSYKRLNLRLTI